MGFLRDDAFWSATPTLLSAVISVTPVLLPSRPLPCKQYPLWLPRSSLLQHAVICHLSSIIHRPRRTPAASPGSCSILAALLCCIIIRDVCLPLHHHMGCLSFCVPVGGWLRRVLLPSMIQDQVVKT